MSGSVGGDPFMDCQGDKDEEAEEDEDEDEDEDDDIGELGRTTTVRPAYAGVSTSSLGGLQGASSSTGSSVASLVFSPCPLPPLLLFFLLL